MNVCFKSLFSNIECELAEIAKTFLDRFCRAKKFRDDRTIK